MYNSRDDTQNEILPNQYKSVSDEELKNNNNANKYDDFIKNSPIPLLEMDFSQVPEFFRALEYSSDEELKDILDGDPVLIDSFKSKIFFIKLNDSAKSIFGTGTVEELDAFFSGVFLKSDPLPIVKMVLQMGKGELKGDFEWEIKIEDKKLDTHIYWNIPAVSRADLSHVFISVVDITKNKEFEYELIQKSTLQKVINSIYNLGLQNLPIQEVFNKVVRLVAQFLDAEYCKILKYQSEHNNLKLISGYGWNQGIVGIATVQADENSQAGFTLLSDRTVVVNDLLEETRFKGPDLLLEHNVRSGMSTIIKTEDQIYGILGVHSTQVENFSVYSIDFFNSIALFLSNLISREYVQSALTASKQLYEDLYQTAPFMYFNIDFDTGMILNYNAEVMKTLGYSKEDLHNKLITEIYHQKSYDRLDDEIIRLVKKGRVKDVEFTVIKKDGSLLDVLINAIGIKDETGKLVLTRSIWMDITERKKAQSKIIEQTKDIQNINRILNLKNRISDIVLFTNNETDLNQKVCNILGNDDTLKFAWIGYLRPDKFRSIEPMTISTEYNSYLQLFDYKTITDDVETNPISQAIINKKLVILNQDNLPTNYPHGNEWITKGNTKSIIILPLVVDDLCIGILSIYSLIDYSSEKESEIDLFKEIANTLAFTIKAIRVENSQLMILQQLEDQKIQSLKLLTAIEQSPNIILITNPDGNIEYTNPKFTEITGYDLHEVINQNPRILRSDTKDDEEYKILWETISSGKEWHGEFMNKKKDGSFYWALASIAPVIDISGQVINYIGIQRDITELKRNESRINELQKMEAIGRLAAGISHDFKNILATISLNVDYIEANLYELDPLREETKEIRKGVNMATSTIQQLLAFSGSSEIKDYVKINFKTIIDKLLTWIQRLVGSEIEIIKEIHCDNPIILGNRTSAEQVLINLLINAKDAMSYGGTISISINEIKNIDGLLYHDDEILYCSHLNKDLVLEMVNNKPYYLLQITDNGMGIPEDILPFIFEPYFTTKAPGKGTGLGLSTVYSIIKRFGGSIYATSRIDYGTCFRILLPKYEETD
jgi:PAS domain S-box-containing protein